MTTKLSNVKVAQVLRDAATSLSTLTAERDKLAAENAELKSRDECSKLAHRMHEKGIDLDTPVEALTTHLQKQASVGKLGEITRAVDMIGPNMSFGSTAGETAGGGLDPLTSFILGNVG